MTDQDPMPFGIHKGKSMANVPDSYLIWIYNRIQIKAESGNNLTTEEACVQGYIDDFGVENLTET